MTLQIETQRLVLKPMTEADATDLYTLNIDPEVIRYTGDGPFKSVEEALDFIRGYDVFEKYGRGRFSTFIKGTGEYIGWCGLAYLSKKNEFDIGYRFMKKYWGKGYATESASACLRDGFTRLRLEKIIASAMKENVASINVFKKLGLKYSYDENCGGEPGVIYTIMREEWEDRQNKHK